MIPPDLQIVGIASIEFDPESGAVLRLRLSDGSLAACWWSTDMLMESMAVVTQARHAPAGAVMN